MSDPSPMRLFVDLALPGGGGARLRFDPDPEGSRSSWLRAGDHAIVHDDRRLAPELANATHAMRDRLRGRVGDPLVLLAEALDGAVEGARLSLRRRLLVDQPLPGWNRRARIGFPEPGAVWPFDPELAQLEVGLRRILKRDASTDEEAARDRAWLESHGLEVRVMPPDETGYRVLIATRESDELRDAVEAERAIQAGSAEAEGAVARLGRALGYPACCVEPFLSLGPRDDLSLAAWSLPAAGAAPAPPWSVWLTACIALVSHTPCRLDCPATLVLARATADALDERSPGFRAAWLRQARGIHVVDRAGRLVRLQIDGELGEGATCADAEVLVADASSHYAWRVLPELASASLELAGGGLSAPGLPFVADLVADHRGLVAGFSTDPA